MASKSKENQVLDLILENSPTKQWHFTDLLNRTSMTKASLNKWLTKYQKEKLLKKIKRPKKFAYYEAGQNNPTYQSKKRVYALQLMEQSGFLDHLASLKDAKVIILFGSFSRWDWYKDSDIDIFIYGDDGDIEQARFELKLKKEIQIHHAKDKKGLRKISKMLPYIIAGDFIKGSIEDLGVRVHA